MSPEPENRTFRAARWGYKYLYHWLGVVWIVLGVFMISDWAWGWADGALTQPMASDRFRAWVPFVIGWMFAVLGIVWIVVARRTKARSHESNGATRSPTEIASEASNRTR